MTTKIKVSILTILLCLLTLSVGVMFAAGGEQTRQITATITSFDAPSGMRWNPGKGIFEIYNYSGISLVASGLYVDALGNYGSDPGLLAEPERATGNSHYVVMKDITYNGEVAGDLPRPNFMTSTLILSVDGIFDGGGYMLTNFPLRQWDASRSASIFSTNNGLVRNIVSNYTTKLSFISAYTGVICYTNNTSGIFENCKLMGKANLDGASNPATQVGGLIFRNNGKVRNCTNEMDLSSRDFAGGIAAFNERQIVDCNNKGDISSNVGAGGIVGRAEGIQADIIFQNCVNSGNISGTGNPAGISGEVMSNPLRVTFLYCENIGEINGETGDGKHGITFYIITIKTVTFVECYGSINVGTPEEKKFRWHALDVGDAYTPEEI